MLDYIPFNAKVLIVCSPNHLAEIKRLCKEKKITVLRKPPGVVGTLIDDETVAYVFVYRKSLK